jgi:hypothetical protein
VGPHIPDWSLGDAWQRDTTHHPCGRSHHTQRKDHLQWPLAFLWLRVIPIKIISDQIVMFSPSPLES